MRDSAIRELMSSAASMEASEVVPEWTVGALDHDNGIGMADNLETAWRESECRESATSSSLATGAARRAGGRRSRRMAASIAMVGALTSGMLASCSDDPSRHGTSPTPTPTALKTTGVALPLKATHDAHGLIVTLPEITSVLGRTPLPDVTLFADRTYPENLNGIQVIKEEGGGLSRTSEKYRMLNITLLRYPSAGLIGKSWGIEGPGPYREDAHHWYGVSGHIANLGDAAIVFQTGDASSGYVAGRSIDFDVIGGKIEARYKNVMIDIALNGADYDVSVNGKVRVTHESFAQTKRKLMMVAKEIVEHL
ncbi:hypothetical protein [Actinoallomurus rhizosphaericola]|uniref:hypothetical protein n=1 Tax=Actinoallomurus rhizosphaericola TaxID=2952536 RepID=UPI002090AD80|nr:hypothetical protein [Actinoallomurus rhizosphaericola]MCO5994602.1 hypothetical protein [Actinoallomurus rhizosphaericola]